MIVLVVILVILYGPLVALAIMLMVDGARIRK